MLKVFGHVYSGNENDFKAIKEALENEGYQIAYEGDNNGDIIKEVTSLNGEDEDAES